MYPFPRDTRVSQKFGANATQYNLSGKHTGEDAAVPVGTPVHAAGDGKVVAAGYFPNYNNEWLYGPMGGLTLVLDCGVTEPTFGYAHLSQVLVKEGDYVRKGQVVALSGESGAATGPHTHTEALPPNWNTYNGTYGRVDPRIYMTEFPGEVTAQGAIAPQEDELSDVQVERIINEVNAANEAKHAATRSKIDDAVKSINFSTQQQVEAVGRVTQQLIIDKASPAVIAERIDNAGIAKEVANELAKRLVK
jgi:septal ring factor EnvC (AmiA/AmiB activator)